MAPPYLKCVVSFKKKGAKNVLESKSVLNLWFVQSSPQLEILILKINSIESLPNLIVGSEVGRLSQIGPWSRIYVVAPSIDQ
jgi:hypothetical protein